jgi:hypothetical protein
MKERRRTPRHRCRLRVELQHRGQRREASLLDVSLSGLSIQVGIPLAQGDPVELSIEGQVRVKALAWHTHRLKRAGAATFVVGMMLSEVGPDYEALVARVAGSRPVPRVAPGAPRTDAGPEASGAPPAPSGPAAPAAGTATAAPVRRRAPPLPAARPLWWRLRLKQTNGSRSRMVTLAAASQEAAVAGSLAEAGEGWEVLEVVKAS